MGLPPDWYDNDYDTWADDLAGLIEQLDLTNVTLIAHSMGGGEITRYVGRYGTSRLAKMVFIGAVPPIMLHRHEPRWPTTVGLRRPSRRPR